MRARRYEENVPGEAGESLFAKETDPHVIIPNRNYTAGEVARLVLRISATTFRHHRKALMAEGFPRPISNTYLAPWYGQDLIDWLAREKGEAAARPFTNVTRLTDVLRQRAAKLASGNR